MTRPKLAPVPGPDVSEETALSTPDTPPPWWHDAVIYEIYPRSFADADGDGEGDLAGLIGRLPYLVSLGVDAIWIAPWYPSPMADGGYDVIDYCDINPRLGTLADADRLLDEAHALGLLVVVDMVANHTSSDHPWFRAALEAPPGSPERRRYYFRDGTGPGGDLPPNNWISAFGSSAWTRVNDPDGSPGQWYLHTFASAQPDLDWEEEGVLEAFDEILRFWLDRGVDGFRVDAAPAMAKETGLPDAVYSPDLTFDSTGWVGNPHWDVDGVHDVMRRWRALSDSYVGDRIFVAEAVVNGPDRLARYVRPDELHTAFNFDYVHAGWTAAELRAAVDGTLRALEPLGAPATWAMSSHDEVRHVTRFGRDAGWQLWGGGSREPADLELGTRRARAAILLTLALPGGAYLYQGEELGLDEVEDLPDAVRQDPVFHRSGGAAPGRDGCRVPLPWEGARPPFGFSPPGTTPWLPQPARWSELTVEAQDRDPGSMLSLYRAALRIRRDTAHRGHRPLEWLRAPEEVLHFQRGDRFQCLVNLGADDMPVAGRVLISSGPLPGGRLVPPDTAAWVELPVP